MYSGDTTEYMMFRGTGKTVPLLLPAQQNPAAQAAGFLFLAISLFNKQFCDLYRVCCSAFAYLISAAPEIDAVLVHQIAADPSDIHDVLIGCK